MKAKLRNINYAQNFYFVGSPTSKTYLFVRNKFINGKVAIIYKDVLTKKEFISFDGEKEIFILNPDKVVRWKLKDEKDKPYFY
jgi:hypothetical protein